MNQEVKHAVMPDGSEIWYVGDLPKFDEEPINIFEEMQINVPYSKSKPWKYLSGDEWTARCLGMDIAGDYFI